jgi:hypothetical protein
MKSNESDYVVFNWFDRTKSIHTGAGDDSILDNSAASDSLYSGRGDDFIFTSAGRTRIHAGSGDDDIVVQANTYTVQGFIRNPDGTKFLVQYEQGYNVSVNGGPGHDVLTIEHSAGHRSWTDEDGSTHITMDNGESIVAKDIEEFHFV